MPVVGNKSQYIEKKMKKSGRTLYAPPRPRFLASPHPLGVSRPFRCPFDPCWSRCRVGCRG
jgi:hypothetical protein